MGWPDFEDAVQYRCAVQISADRIITRNPRHFANSNIPVVTPAEFLVALSL